ncbi:hypothetical protein HXX76_003664 [Chlamydomonas incerta]|uniref:Uncharacterized protein n=1 Tax=Chlamydomonas incerta TaxID=51695 RepID=A0A835TI53_CHLIN|nr:hypothetical protein HXX76_003664 [Chlamydomonas incerta]|eukprot:KAG2440809.1 hypothetical protein HXX76_003664 [Chlamydomonas incerta]
MARKCLTTVVVCLLASSVAAQVLSDKKTTLEESFPDSRKSLSHLERMLQVEAEPEPEPKEPAGASCSPASLTERSDCAATAVTTNQPAPSTTTTSKPGPQPTCTGPDCLVAPMPGQLGAPTRPVGEAATQAPQTRPMTYGPMTSVAFDRMVAKKRAAVRAKMAAAGGIDGVLKTFMEVRADPFKEAAAQVVPRHAADQAGIPLPSASAASASAKKPAVKADFEMRFAAEAPAMVPANDEEAVLADEAAARSHTPAAAGRAWGSSEAALKQRMQQQQQQDQPKGPGRPPMTEEEAAKLAVQAAARQAGLGRKKMAVQAGRPVDRQAALSAAMQAKQSAKPTALPTRAGAGQQQQQQQGRPMRGMTPSGAAGAADYKTMPSASRSGFAGRGPREPRIEVEFHTMPGASRPATELPDADRVPESLLRPKPQPQQQPSEEAAAPQHVRSDIERVLLLEQPAAAAVVEEEPREPAPKPAKTVKKPSARMSHVAFKMQQRMQADQAAQARRWAAFDYACAGLLLMVAPVAVFLAAAVLEDLFMKPEGAVSSTSSAASWADLPARWAELTASLWRRTRRAAAVALKSLPGAQGGDQLPMCSHQGPLEATSHATGVADATVRRRH